MVDAREKVMMVVDWAGSRMVQFRDLRVILFDVKNIFILYSGRQ